MIRQIDAKSSLPEFVDDILLGYLTGMYEAYGIFQGFLRFYLDDYGALIAVMDGVATVRCGASSYEEIACFLGTLPELRAVRTDRWFAEYLCSIWKQAPEFRPVMRCDLSVQPVGETRSASPREVYPLLASVFPDFPPVEEWYLDVSYRMRHGFCRNCAIWEGDTPAASAMTVAEWQSGAVIGAVATAEEHRRKGYASVCVTALTEQLQREGKQVFICPKNAGAQRIYESIGFTVCGEMAWIERK